jgi:hypothetical protein
MQLAHVYPDLARVVSSAGNGCGRDPLIVAIRNGIRCSDPLEFGGIKISKERSFLRRSFPQPPLSLLH